MKIQKRIIIILILTFLIVNLLTNHNVFATNIGNIYIKMEYTDEFKQWLELDKSEQEKILMPFPYEIPYQKINYQNPFYQVRMLKSGLNDSFDLRKEISANMKIKNQMNTGSCWTFASLSTLETTLALADKKNGRDTSKVYDYSERHMEYASSDVFSDSQTNPLGYHREVGTGANWLHAETYLINGNGAVLEKDMPFENNEEIIAFSEVSGKNIATQVYDTVLYSDYNKLTGDERTAVINQVKQHIQNYGAVFGGLHGGTLESNFANCYNNETGAKYCSNSIIHKTDHGVSIVGWNDNYDISKFAEGAQPKEKGAWIIRNSWGERAEEYNLAEIKQEIFNKYEQQCISRGWTEASLIPNEYFTNLGYIIDGDVVYMPLGDDGFMYVSYEDCNISSSLWGITKAESKANYDHIYQYDVFAPVGQAWINSSKIMLRNVYEKKSTGKEYINAVALQPLGTYTAKVYINPNGTTINSSSQLVQLKSGESEIVSGRYNTLELAEPIEITGKQFAIGIELENKEDNEVGVYLETTLEETEILKNVKIESNKCFIGSGNSIENYQWDDLGMLSSINSSLTNGDSTIKAFTTTSINDDSLKNIEITTPPTKTKYIEGENFDKTGMVVTAYFNNNTSQVLGDTEYSITNGTSLRAGQTSVTITYQDKSINQTISVEKNSVVDLKITTPPTTTIYKEGYDFDKTGMVVTAYYKDKTNKEVKDYTVEDGTNLKATQTSVTISYGGKTVIQTITVNENPLVEIKIANPPTKTKYVVGQSFDKTGMKIIAKYEDGLEKEITNYTIENGSNLVKDQTSVIISYGGKTVIQNITVVEKTITGITINQKPKKLTYILNEETLDLTGGSIKVTYNDGTSEIVAMTSEDVKVTGFKNTSVGKIKLTITYMNKTVELEIEIIARTIEEKAENSNFDKANVKITKIIGAFFTNGAQEDYSVAYVEVKDVVRNLKNDKLEYYYYVSKNQNEKNIKDWTKISEEQKSEKKLNFKLDTRNMPNPEDAYGDEQIYIYIKEVAIKGGDQAVFTSKPLAIQGDEDIVIEIYLNNEKVIDDGNYTGGFGNKPTTPTIPENPTNTGGTGSTNSGKDPTIAGGIIPQTGGTIFVITAIIGITGIGIYVFIRYKKLSKYIK